MKAIALIFSLASCMSVLANVSGPLPFAPGMEEPQHLIAHNRILAKINDKSISVLDVMKKMDVYIDRVYPHLSNSKLAKYQFYTANWKQTLDQMIDDELIMLDSEGKDFKIHESEVRGAIQERFGPNVMHNLDKLGLSFDEAKSMIYSELLVQRMMWFRVNSKAIISVNPQDVKAAYKEYLVQNPPVEEWKYQVLSIRAKDNQLAKSLASKAYSLLNENAQTNFKDVSAALKENPRDAEFALVSNELQPSLPEFTITVSEDFQVNDKSLSQSHKEALAVLSPGEYGKPVAQVSRTDNSTVYRIFLLNDHTITNPPTFKEIEDKLENGLIQQAINREAKAYITKLKEKFGYTEKHMQEIIPDDFEPFSLN